MIGTYNLSDMTPAMWYADVGWIKSAPYVLTVSGMAKPHLPSGADVP